MVTSMLDKAFATIPMIPALSLHSDQGWHESAQAVSTNAQKEVYSAGMSRKGNCLDNAVMENFFGLLKK
jgi:putative transposase